MNRYDLTISMGARIMGIYVHVVGRAPASKLFPAEGPWLSVVAVYGPANRDEGCTATLTREIDPRDPAAAAVALRDLFRQWEALDAHRAHMAMHGGEDDMACEDFGEPGDYDRARAARDALSHALPFAARDRFMRFMRTVNEAERRDRGRLKMVELGLSSEDLAVIAEALYDRAHDADNEGADAYADRLRALADTIEAA